MKEEIELLILGVLVFVVGAVVHLTIPALGIIIVIIAGGLISAAIFIQEVRHSYERRNRNE